MTIPSIADIRADHAAGWHENAPRLGCLDCPNLGRPQTDTATRGHEARITAALEAAQIDTRNALAETLMEHFPEATSGDMSPETAMSLEDAVATFAREWVRLNVPAPLTMSDALAALRVAHDALAAVAETCAADHIRARHGTAGNEADTAREALAAVRGALIRSGTYNDPPRP